MKTKNLFIAIVLVLGILFNVNSVKAEGGPTNTDNVTLKIKLKPIQTILVNPSQKEVEFLYASTDNYNAGVSKEQKDHLTVFSTGGFEVKVQANSDFKRENGTEAEVISVKDVKVTATSGTGEKNVGNFSDVTLSTTEGLLITASKGGRNMKYNVTYDNTAGGTDAYIDKYIVGDGAESVYTTEVTYTIAAK